MIGGRNMISNRYALSAAAAVLATGLAFSPAKAADLGGDCCADLEERVAELEATTVRKGNRKVSLKVSGFVSKSVMIWDDGDETDAYVVETASTTLQSNVTFSGEAKINNDWAAGYQITLELPGGGTALSVSQDNPSASAADGRTLISSIWVKSNQFGKLSWGKQSHASDNAALLVDLSGSIIQSNYVQIFQGGSFATRGDDGGVLVNIKKERLANWGDLTPCASLDHAAGASLDCKGLTTNNVRYDSPAFGGFSVSASWGEDDFWDVAINYAGDFGDFKLKAAYAYTKTDDEVSNIEADFHQVGASILHKPSGLFVYGAYVKEELDSAPEDFSLGYTDKGYYVKAGIRQNWTGVGDTVFYGEYQRVDADGFKVKYEGVKEVFDATSEFTQYGVGIVQYIDSASLQLHANWKHKEGEFSSKHRNDDLDDLDLFQVGATIFF